MAFKSIKEIQEYIDKCKCNSGLVVRYAKIGFDGKSLFVRIPAKIRDLCQIKAGQYMVFSARGDDL